MGPDDAGLRELLQKARLLIAGGISDFTDSEEFMEEITKINQEMAEKYGRIISHIITATKVITAEAEIIDENQPARKSRTIPRIDVGTAEDRKFLQGLKISANEGEISELRADFERARRGNGDPVPEGRTQQTDTDQTSSDRATNRLRRLTDSRLPEEIINSILGLAYKLDWDNRLFFANNVNTAYGGLASHFPENQQLANDKFWLSKIEELIKVLADAKENKIALLNLEFIFRKIYEGQEGGGI